jgi:site-specific DNA-cytosine methylase
MENVKNLIGKKFKADFDSWCTWLEEQGYTNYYSVLNSKMFGVPQNRERVFMISIIGEHEPYEFPQGFPLQYKLKDFLQPQVEEKYYLSDEIQSRFKFQSQGSNVIGTTAPDFRTIGQRDLVYGPDGNMGALVATDYKQPKQVIESLEVDKPVRLGGVFDEENGTRHQAGSVYDKDGISPTIDTGQGGWRQPLITEDTYVINENETFTYNHSGNNVIGEMGGSLWDSRHESIRRVYDTETIAPSITSCQGGGTHPEVLTESIEYNGQNVELPVCVASRGRNPTNPSDRKSHSLGTFVQILEMPTEPQKSHTLTSVYKDNLVLEYYEIL